MTFNGSADRSSIRQNLSLCQDLLKSDRIKRKFSIRRISLSLDDQQLFQSEDLLSPYQNIIANAHGRHVYQTEVLFQKKKE